MRGVFAMTKDEIMKKMEDARSWREAGITIDEMRDFLSRSSNESSNEELQELRERVAKLTETNKQLRAENKQLKAR